MKRNRNGISLFLKRKIDFFETENHWPYYYRHRLPGSYPYSNTAAPTANYDLQELYCLFFDPERLFTNRYYYLSETKFGDSFCEVSWIHWHIASSTV